MTCQLPLGPAPSTGPAPKRLWGDICPAHALAEYVHADFHQKPGFEDFRLQRQTISFTQEVLIWTLGTGEHHVSQAVFPPLDNTGISQMRAKP